VVGFFRRDRAGGLADDDAEFALIGGLAGIGGGAADDGAGGGDRRRGLQQVKRLRRLGLIKLGGERVKIIPQRDDLARVGRRQQLDVVERKRLAAGPGRAEHVAVMDGDALARQRAETGFAVVTKTKPRGHANAAALGWAGRTLASYSPAMLARWATSASTASSAGVGILVRRPISWTTVTRGSSSTGRPRSRSCSIEVLCAPTLRAPSMRRSTSTRNLTPKFSAIAWASSMIAFDSARVPGSMQITSSVAWLKALIGLKQTLPQ